MGEGRLNALMLPHVQKDRKLDCEKIIDIYANRHPCGVRFSNLFKEL